MLSCQQTIVKVLTEAFGSAPYWTLVNQLQKAVTVNNEKWFVCSQIKVLLWQNYPDFLRVENVAVQLAEALKVTT